MLGAADLVEGWTVGMSISSHRGLSVFNTEQSLAFDREKWEPLRITEPIQGNLESKISESNNPEGLFSSQSEPGLCTVASGGLRP